MPYTHNPFFPIERPQPHLITCALRQHDGESQVHANVDVSEHCPLTVEVLDEAFKPVPGFSGDDSRPLRAPGLRQPVSWEGGERLPADLKAFRLRVNCGEGTRPEDARLFALYVGQEPRCP